MKALSDVLYTPYYFACLPGHISRGSTRGKVFRDVFPPPFSSPFVWFLLLQFFSSAVRVKCFKPSSFARLQARLSALSLVPFYFGRNEFGHYSRVMYGRASKRFRMYAKFRLSNPFAAILRGLCNMDANGMINSNNLSYCRLLKFSSDRGFIDGSCNSILIGILFFRFFENNLLNIFL